jgi:epoxyqueuosine reductase
VSLESEIKSLAVEAGFCSVGIAQSDLVKNAHKVMSKASSIVSVAYSYPAYRDIDPPILRGKVARFARGRDYHLEVGDRLEILGRRVAELCGASWGLFVDTSPISDRSAAQLAGVGGFGKNTCIITSESGSWVVLGGIVTDLPLVPDNPADSPCGDCSICLEACPTGALIRPFHLDRSRCISNLTQTRGVVPEHLRPMIGRYVYGCDICQEVCPKNNLLPPPTDSDYFEYPFSAYPDLTWLVRITEDEFLKFVRPTAAGWIGRNTIRRNAAIALGNSGSRLALDALNDALKDADEILREHIEWAINRITGS